MEYVRNKKASFDYSFDETIEAGVELLGTEVKSVKAHHGSLNGAYITVVAGELYLLGAHIPAWQEKNVPVTYDPYRTRKLLVHKRELYDVTKALTTKGLTVIAISLYNKAGKIKLQLAIAKGKKNVDKRNTLKEKADKRDIDRLLKEQQ